MEMGLIILEAPLISLELLSNDKSLKLDVKRTIKALAMRRK